MNRLLAVLCVVVAIIGFNLWPFLGKGFFYKALAMHFTLTYTTAYRLARQVGPPDIVPTKAMLCGVALSFSNLLDEFYFDPTAIQVNEYVAALVVIAIIVLPRTLWKK